MQRPLPETSLVSSVTRQRNEGQWCRIGLEKKGWPANYAIVRSLDFALNAMEVLEGFKQRSDI